MISAGTSPGRVHQVSVLIGLPGLPAAGIAAGSHAVRRLLRRHGDPLRGLNRIAVFIGLRLPGLPLRGALRGLRRLRLRSLLGNHTASGSFISLRGPRLVKSAVRRNFGADRLHRVRRIVILVAEQELMKKHHVALQRLRNDAGALGAHARVASRRRESAGLAHVKLVYIPGQIHHLAHLHVGGQVGEHSLDDGVERRPVRLLRLLKGQVDDLSLSFGSGKVRVHQTQTAIGHRLHAVQMVHARMGQMFGRDARRLHSLRNKRVNIVKLRFAQLQIHAAQDVDGIGHRFPVEGHVVGHIQIQVPVECPDRLLRTAVKIGLVDLVVAVFIVDIQVGVAVHRHQLYLARILVYVADDIYIRVGSLSDDRTAVVHAEDGDGPVALHLLLLLLCQFQVHNLLLVEGKPLDQIHAAL